jgi:hypothetical protein
LNCKTVLLADSSDYNGTYTITANPLKDISTGTISIDSIQITFNSTTYLVNEKILIVIILKFLVLD